MANPVDNALKLMVIDDSIEDAETIVSSLRNSGIAVRPSRPESADALEASLADTPSADLILADADATGIPLDEVIKRVVSSGKDIPLIAVVDQIDTAGFNALHISGVRRIVLRDNPQLLLNIVRDEWGDLEARRNLRQLEARIRETDRRCDALIESSRDPIAYVHEGMYIRANSAYLQLFGYDDFEDIEGLSILDMVSPRDVDGFRSLIKDLTKGEPPPSAYEFHAVDADGATFSATMELAHAQYEGEPCLQVLLRRDEFDPELAKQLEELKTRDLATGLLNRSSFLKQLEDAVAGVIGHQSQHGLLMIEADHFQQVLQGIGLDSADDLLESLAARIRTVLDDDSIAARFSDNRFAVLSQGADYRSTAALAKQLIEAFRSQPLQVGDNSSLIGVSIGAVLISEKIANVSQVLARADEGLRSAIELGGSRFEIFDPGAIDRAEAEHMHAWAEILRKALAENHFITHYQPIVSLQGDTDAFYEVLLRLDTGTDEPVKPVTFMHIAESEGLMEAIDRHVISQAIATIARRLADGRPTTLLVKLSQGSALEEAFADYIDLELRKSGVPGRHLILALPESKIFTHLHAVQRFCEAVDRLGCRLLVEQFGTGLDSFQLLAHLKPHLIKIDRSFIIDLPRNKGNEKSVAAIARKARELGVQTIAEFVQDAASMSILFLAGVDYVEGSFLGEPGAMMEYEFA